MEIVFCGAAQTVTGSKHLIKLANGKQILLDCGMFQGLGNETDELNSNFGFNSHEIDHVILSHAHIDHSGLLPKLVKEGFSGNIFSTPPTKDLTAILLEDSANIQQADTATSHEKEEVNSETFFDLDDVIKTMSLFETEGYDEWFDIDEGVACMFSNAGHIIGSAAVHLRIKEKNKTVALSFSGDVGRYNDVILRPPAPFPQADYIILESTYGNKLHDVIFSTTDEIKKIIRKTCIEKKGNLLIPAFSVGRTQELLFFLNQLSLENRLNEIPVIVDSPLSAAATNIVKRYPEYFNERIQKILQIDDDPFDFPGLHFTRTVEDSRKIEELKEPFILIAASGMASAGRIVKHLTHNLEDRRNTILIVGYCSAETIGGQLMRGAKEVEIRGKYYKVNAEIINMQSMSAHADSNDLIKFLACQDSQKIKEIFLVHGEYDVQTEFAKKLEQKGFKSVKIPCKGCSVKV